MTKMGQKLITIAQNRAVFVHFPYLFSYKITMLESEGGARAPVPHSWRRQCVGVCVCAVLRLTLAINSGVVGSETRRGRRLPFSDRLPAQICEKWDYDSLAASSSLEWTGWRWHQHLPAVAIKSSGWHAGWSINKKQATSIHICVIF